MTLEKLSEVDAVGLEAASGKVVLTIVDSWDWSEEHSHLLALQAKLNTYFTFIEDGQLTESYPQAAGRSVLIDLIGRHPLPIKATELLRRAEGAVADLGIAIRFKHIP